MVETSRKSGRGHLKAYGVVSRISWGVCGHLWGQRSKSKRELHQEGCVLLPHTILPSLHPRPLLSPLKKTLLLPQGSSRCNLPSRTPRHASRRSFSPLTNHHPTPQRPPPKTRMPCILPLQKHPPPSQSPAPSLPPPQIKPCPTASPHAAAGAAAQPAVE